MDGAPNRRPGLIGCGVVLLLFGLMFLGFCALMAVTFAASSRAVANAALTPGMMIYTCLLYLTLAALFVSLGMGSMLARRWAPPLIQVISWAWLFVGVAGGAMMLFMWPAMSATMPRSQPGAQAFAIGCMAIVFGLFGIAVPLAFLLFYRRPDVKATVETLDPVPRWTDRQPVSILIFAAWMFFGAITVLLTTFMYRALPFGGFTLRGPLLFAALAAMATLMFFIGVGTLRRLKAAWWSALVLLIGGVVWGGLMMKSMNAETIADAMGMPMNPQQAALTNAMYSSPFFYVWMGVTWLGYLAFLLYIRRYFFPRSERPAV